MVEETKKDSKEITAAGHGIAVFPSNQIMSVARSSLTTMNDNSTDLSTDKLVPQAPLVATDTTSSPVATPPVVTPVVVDSAESAPDTTARIAASNVTPQAQELPQRGTVVDPRIIALHAMFPDYDDIILCVRSTRYFPVNPLLNLIAIPGYLFLILWAGVRIAPLMPYSVWVIQNTKVNHPLQCNQNNRLSCVLSAPNPNTIFLTTLQSQTELDEQFARHLMIEEQQQRQQQWVNTNRQPPVAYESHPSQRRWNSQPQPDEGGAMAENSTGDFHEQFNKIAES